jgi:hypothetical protein
LNDLTQIPVPPAIPFVIEEPAEAERKSAVFWRIIPAEPVLDLTGEQKSIAFRLVKIKANPSYQNPAI